MGGGGSCLKELAEQQPLPRDPLVSQLLCHPARDVAAETSEQHSRFRGAAAGGAQQAALVQKKALRVGIVCREVSCTVATSPLTVASAGRPPAVFERNSQVPSEHPHTHLIQQAHNFLLPRVAAAAAGCAVAAGARAVGRSACVQLLAVQRPEINLA